MGKNAESQAFLEKEAQISSQWVYEGAVIKIRNDIIRAEGRPLQKWDIIVHPGAVALIPIDQHGNLVLVEQWRRAIEKITLEIPAGMLDPGETPLICAQRELQEEIGHRAETLSSFGGFYSAPGIYTEYIHLFLAKDLVPSRLVADDTDVIDIQRVSLKNALAMIEDGTICDAKTIVGIYKYAQTL